MDSTTLSAFFDELEKIGQGGMMGERLRLGATGPGATASMNQLVSGGGLSGGGSSAGAEGLNPATMGGAAGASMGGGPGAGSVGAAGAGAMGAGAAQAPTTPTKGGTSGESLLGPAARRPTASDLGI